MEDNIFKTKKFIKKNIISGIEVGDPGKILQFKKTKNIISGIEVSDPGKETEQEKRLNTPIKKAA
jgi:hypothetical protein